MDFTLNGYQELLKLAISENYNIVFYEDLGVFNKEMIIRHDIDFSLEKALEIAQLEYNMGVKSTYFVLISSPFYNLYSDANSVIIKSILGYGHKIGLHFDETN